MEQRLANAWHLTVNEKKFIETALLSNLRVDGRCPFDYRQLTINFGREDGSSEVQLGQTHVMGLVTAQLVQPYRDRPNEGSLTIYTEFSPMADPSFEAGRPGESAVELGRIIDRGLRESRAVDTESLCVVAGKLVWSIRIDLYILDNGGNLVDAANIAALVALMTFRRPECTAGGEDGQEVMIHPPEVLEPLPLILHHLPIAMTFAFISDNNIAVIDPTHYEEAIMKGRMTVTLNANGDVCAIQKAGGVGIMCSVIMQCLRIAAVKAADIISKIETAVESYNNERALSKINIHSSAAALIVDSSHSKWEDERQPSFGEIETAQQIKKSASQVNGSGKTSDMENEEPSSRCRANTSDIEAKISIKGPSCWDPYSKGVDSALLRAFIACRGKSVPKKEHGLNYERRPFKDNSCEQLEIKIAMSSSVDVSDLRLNTNEIKTLQNAVKPKNKRKKIVSSADTG